MRLNFGKRVHGRITPSGLVLVLVLLLLLASAWNTGENLLYIVFGAVFSMFFLSMVAGHLGLRNIALRRSAPHAVFRGECFVYQARLENHKRLLPTLSLRIEQDGDVRAFVLRLPARHRADAVATGRFDRRGVYRLPPCDVVSAFPFGFLEQRRRYEDNVEVLVYPRIRPARLSALERASGAQFVPARLSGEGDEFFALREYVHGDDLRLVVWRISARLGVWMVREMGVGNARVVTFVMDTRYADIPDFDDRFEEMVEITASLALTLLNRNYSVGVLMPDAHIACGKGAAQERRLLDAFARAMPVEAGLHLDFEQRAHRLTSEPMRLLCVSPNPEKWGAENWPGNIPVLDPGAVVYA